MRKTLSNHSTGCKRAMTASGKSSGFSLLEILMAVTVLTIIVLMTSLVFQQTQNAWSSGVRTASLDTTLRTTMGFLERDLTHAIDATPYATPLNGICNATSNIALGAPGGFELMTLDGDATTTTNRMPQLVDYDLSVSASGSGFDLTRKVYPVYVAAGSPPSWSAGPPSMTAVVNGDTPLSSFAITFIPAPAGSMGALPLRADIEAHVITALTNQTFAVVSGKSAGPDGAFGVIDGDAPGKDDIIARPDN